MAQIFLPLLLLNFFIFINYNKIANKLNFFDKPDKELKRHKSKVPLLGGVIIFVNLFIFFLLNFIIVTKFSYHEITTREFISIFFLISSFFLLGLYDDKFNLKPEKKFFLSILFSSIAILINQNLMIEKISLSFYEKKIFLNNLSFLFTIFCIIILINALNFYDGINGQSLTFFLIAFSFLGYRSPILFFYLFIIFIIIFLLFLNLKNKLFLGDNGIYILGILLAVSIIYEHNISESIIFADEIFLLLVLPGLDLLRLTIIRIINNKNAFYGDRNHIHHIFLNNFSLLKTNILLIILSILPIIFFLIFKMNFFIVLSFFVTIYLLLIFYLKKHD